MTDAPPLASSSGPDESGPDESGPDESRPDESGPDYAEAVESRLLDAAVRLAPQLGWTERLVAAAARDAGVSEAEARLVLPKGPRDLAALLWRRHDAQALAVLRRLDPAAMKVRERIRAAVEARVEAAAADAAAERKASPYLALPQNQALTLRLAWATADALWRWAGDTATDENHYSKRAILSGVLLSTAVVRLGRGREAAQAHLDARIADVMRFETWKAGLPKVSGFASRVAERLGRLRYGSAMTDSPRA